MNYIEIKDSPKNITDTNKYTTESYPETGVYRSPDLDKELIFVDKLSIATVTMYIDPVERFLSQGDASVDNINIDYKTNQQQSMNDEFVLKAIAVTQKPELAFKK